MMAEPIKTLELHYPMIQFLINIYNINNNNNITLCAKNNRFQTNVWNKEKLFVQWKYWGLVLMYPDTSFEKGKFKPTGHTLTSFSCTKSAGFQKRSPE